jgi:hypothetical protein
MDANEIRIGMAATVAIGSDRRAATVVAIGGGTNEDGTRSVDRIDVREDAAIRIGGDGISESQSYRFEPNPNGTLWGCKLDANGNWRGRQNLLGKRYPATVFVGRRDHYRDPTF